MGTYDDRQAQGPEPWVISQVPEGLPAGLPGFVGRSREIVEIATLIEDARVVTLTGPPGIGKTRLALEVARRVHASFAGGVSFIDLAPVHDPALVPQVVASALGLDPEPGRDPLDLLCRRLRPRAGLLVLDNCEHLIGACAKLVERVVGDCTGISFLTTSQQPLGISAERMTTVGGLSLPERTRPASVASTTDSEAIRLFCARAVVSHRRFQLTEEIAPPIAEICRRLDGIPLAIELAAARLDALGPAEIAEGIEQRFELLTQGDGDAPARHQTLRAALDWSYDLLTDEEALVLRRLSVFAGGAGLAAVQEVCSGDGIDRANIVNLLTSLVSKSLVVADTSRPRVRYHMLETIRAYGRQRLEEAGEAYAVSFRHASWFTSLVDGSYGEIPSDDPNVCLVDEFYSQISANDPRAWVRTLEADHDNLRAAIEWAIKTDPKIGLSLVISLVPFWETRGYLREGQQWLARMLDAGAAAAEAGTLPLFPPPMRARALGGLGLLATLRGDVDAARRAVEESLRLAREAKLARAEARGLSLLGFISIFTQDALAAKPLLEKSVAMARAEGDRSSVALALAHLGKAHLFLSEIEPARAAFEECRELDEEQPAKALFGLGRTELAAGEEEKARELFERVLPMLRDAGERFDTAVLLSLCGELAWARGDLGAARAQCEDGLEVAGAMGAPFPLVHCLCVLANVALAEDDLDAAARLANEACEVSTSARLPFALVHSLQVRGATKWAAGETDGASQDYDEALSVARSASDPAGAARSLHRLAGVARARDADDEAMDLLHEAIITRAEIGNAGIPSSLEAIAGMGADQGRPAHAARLFGAAEAMRGAHGMPRRPDEIAGFEADVAHLRSVLDVAELAEAWAEGAALSRDEAVALALRGRSPRDPNRPSHGWASLSPTEHQIVDLVAEGLTNREIAERLFISDRTVQGYLTRVFPKLGLTSRRELRERRRLRKR